MSHSVLPAGWNTAAALAAGVPSKAGDGPVNTWMMPSGSSAEQSGGVAEIPFWSQVTCVEVGRSRSGAP